MKSQINRLIARSTEQNLDEYINSLINRSKVRSTEEIQINCSLDQKIDQQAKCWIDRIKIKSLMNRSKGLSTEESQINCSYDQTFHDQLKNKNNNTKTRSTVRSSQINRLKARSTYQNLGEQITSQTNRSKVRLSGQMLDQQKKPCHQKMVAIKPLLPKFLTLL